MRTFLAGAAAALALCLTVSVAHAQKGGDIKGLKIADPQPANVVPGLSVSYRYGIINNVSEMSDSVGEPGEPLPQLNYNVGFGKVLSSKREDGVQARIVGFLKLDKPGQWRFAVKSNDGVRMEIGGKMVYELAGVHSDTMSEVVTMTIDKAGWYPIKILYFEKRETSTLELYLAGPGVNDLSLAPPSAFGHTK